MAATGASHQIVSKMGLTDVVYHGFLGRIFPLSNLKWTCFLKLKICKLWEQYIRNLWQHLWGHRTWENKVRGRPIFNIYPLYCLESHLKKNPTLFLLLVPEYFHHPLEKCGNLLAVTPLITPPPALATAKSTFFLTKFAYSRYSLWMES